MSKATRGATQSPALVDADTHEMIRVHGATDTSDDLGRRQRSDPVRVKGHGSRCRDGVLLAAIGTPGRPGRSAHVVVRWAAGASRGGADRARREVVFASDAVVAGEHETPKDASSKGCRWPIALTLDVHRTWRSGYYEVVMEIDVGEKVRRDYAFFVVRPASGARIVVALTTNTWHAYNDFGGPNLYTGGTHVAMQRPMAAGYLYKPPGRGRRVTGTGAPDPQNAAHVGYVQINHLSGYAGSAGWPDWELPFIQWAEREGFEIAVCTNFDLEEHPEVLDGTSLYLSVGHDEYWSRGMRDSVEAFIASGGNASFFSGNTSLWQVRVEGGDHDVMVGYKSFFKKDPLMGTDREAEVTTFWSDVVVGRPENHMTGVSFTAGDITG